MVGSGLGVGSTLGTAVASASASRLGACKKVVIRALTSTTVSKMPLATSSFP